MTTSTLTSLDRTDVESQLAQLEAIYRHAPVGLGVFDRELRFRRINERLAAINGRPVAEHIGRTVHEILPVIAQDVEARASGVRNREAACRHTAFRRDGRSTGCRASLPRAVVSTVRQHRHGDWHQRGGGGGDRTYSRGGSTARERGTVPRDRTTVQTSQRHLLGLINEVLNYAKLETGAVHYDMAAVRVRDALVAAEALVAPQAQVKQIALAVTDCAPSLVVRADGEKFRQILVNLLSNAVKFTDRGGRVELSCEYSPVAQPGDPVRIYVTDTGIGIASDQLERIFEPFVQVRADLTRTAEGTGLGLAISRDLARGMHGDLRADSTPGVGSTFTPTLPHA